jgi:hypothetical protein
MNWLSKYNKKAGNKDGWVIKSIHNVAISETHLFVRADPE